MQRDLLSQKAKELIKETTLAVDEIANRMGCESDISFIKVFKKHTGLAPRKFLKKE